MSDPVLIALIVGIPGIINALAALKLHKKVDTVKETVETVKGTVETVKETVETVKKEINGRMGQFLKITGESEHAKGVIEGKAQREEPDEQSG